MAYLEDNLYEVRECRVHEPAPLHGLGVGVQHDALLPSLIRHLGMK